MAENKQCEGPSDYGATGGPGEALKMPVKHYPSNDKLGDRSGKGSTLEGPGTDKSK